MLYDVMASAGGCQTCLVAADVRRGSFFPPHMTTERCNWCQQTETINTVSVNCFNHKHIPLISMFQCPVKVFTGQDGACARCEKLARRLSSLIEVKINHPGVLLFCQVSIMIMFPMRMLKRCCCDNEHIFHKDTNG